MKKIGFLVALFANLAVFGQSDRIRYIKKVQEFCANADIIHFEAKTDYVKIEFICDDEVYEVSYNSNLELLLTEVRVEIPDVIMGIINKKLDKSFASWIIDEAALIKTVDTSYYRVEVLSEGVVQNVYFSLEGKNYKTKGVTSNESWKLDNLGLSAYYARANYDFLNPTEVYDLPDILREVSGIVLENDSIMYCVQDELGIIFRYNLIQNEISDILRFTDIGDFEDIAINGDLITVLRSDGALFTVNMKKFNGFVSPRMIDVNSMNLEGLFFDADTRQYYMISKDMTLGQPSKIRTIYSVNEKFKKVKVAQSIDTDLIKSFIHENYPELNSKFLQFNPSALAKHPQSKQWYVLSANNRILAVYEGQELVAVYPLPAEVYFKPEGLAFSPDGTLYISSEGPKNGSVAGQIMKFNLK